MKKKLVALMATLSMIVSTSIACISAQAATVTEGVTLSTITDGDTSKVFDVYYVGTLSALQSFQVTLSFPENTVSSAQFTTPFTGGYDASNLTSCTNGSVVLGYLMFAGSASATDGSVKLGTLTLNVPAGTESFTVSVAKEGYSMYDGVQYGPMIPDDFSVTVGKPAVTNHPNVTADKVAESTELLDAPARGYEATVNYANGTVGKLVWSITAAEQTKTVDAVAAEVSGQPSVIYGLIIVDANVDKVTDVVLTNVVE